MLIVAVGQPLLADDLWWHLGMGASYLDHPPPLSEDPILFAAQLPPRPSAWLSEVVLHGVVSISGFHGLRVAHVLGVLGLLAIVWSLAGRISQRPAVASVATLLFLTTAAYRLVQLRPHLFTIAAALILYRLLIEPRSGPSPGRIAWATVLVALWANLHAGFLLAPLLVLAAIGGEGGDFMLRRATQRPATGQRLLRLTTAFAIVALAPLLNPVGLEAYLVYLQAGIQTPELRLVSDEWAPTQLLHFPKTRLPPSWLTWGSVWALLIATGLIGMRELREWRQRVVTAPLRRVDPSLLALAVVGLVAVLGAVRFSWMLVFPILLCAQALPSDTGKKGSGGWAWLPAGVAIVLLLSFPRLGAWPMVSQILPVNLAGYAQPYVPSKYYGHAFWMLRDSEVEGRLFASYSISSFASYWLTPRLRMFLNGSLNVPQEVMDDYAAVRVGRGTKEGESLIELLDRHRIDFFFGTGLPTYAVKGRPSYYTTALLDGASGWIPIFRNMRSSLFLRDVPRNAANLDRVARYYAEEGLPFDRVTGFDAAAVIAQARSWAREHGLIPINIERQIAVASEAADSPAPRSPLQTLGSVYAALGLRDRLVKVDARQLEGAPEHLGALRRSIWIQLRLGDFEAARRAADRLEATDHDDLYSMDLVRVARMGESLSREEIASLRVLTRSQGENALVGYLPPAPLMSRESDRDADGPDLQGPGSP